jgi:hypothetical protein
MFSLEGVRVIGSVGDVCRTGKSMTVAGSAVVGRVDIRMSAVGRAYYGDFHDLQDP